MYVHVTSRAFLSNVLCSTQGRAFWHTFPDVRGVDTARSGGWQGVRVFTDITDVVAGVSYVYSGGCFEVCVVSSSKP